MRVRRSAYSGHDSLVCSRNFARFVHVPDGIDNGLFLQSRLSPCTLWMGGH